MMVILPGCRCCGRPCGWPSSDGSRPVTIEMDLYTYASVVYAITSDSGEFTHFYYIPNITGTYSLDDFIEYRYDGIVTLRVIGIASGVDDGFDILVEINPNYELIINNNWTSVEETYGGGTGFDDQFVDHCEAGQRTRYTSISGFSNTAQNHADNVVVAYETDCSFPATISYRHWIKLNGFSVGNFPYTKTVGTDTFYGFDVELRIIEIRYLFASETLVGFEDIGQTDCSPP